MRIIAGTLRRRQLKAPKGQITRPTTDRVKESLFNMLTSRFDFEQSDVLDLFAGTGSLGFEAISRGATSVTFVEQNAKVMKCCRGNARQLEVEDTCVFFQTDAVSFLRSYKGPPFDVVFADPPYELEALPRLPDRVMPFVAPHGIFALEHDQSNNYEDHPLLETSRAYGRTIVSIFMHSTES